MIADNRWRGAFVEPLPYFLERCRWNYSFYSPRRFQFIQAAVSDEPGEVSFWKIKDSSLHQFAPFAAQVVSMDPADVLKHCENADRLGAMEQIHVPRITYLDLLERTGMNRVDLLAIDAEGHEPRILASLGSGMLLPAGILFKRSHINRTDWAKVSAHLEGLGYRLQLFPIDCFAVRE